MSTTPQPAYLIMLCTEIIDRAELEKYWTTVASTVDGINVQPVITYSRFEKLEGEQNVQGVYMMQFPSFEVAKAWYESPAYKEVCQHRLRGSKYLGILAEAGMAPFAAYAQAIVRFRDYKLTRRLGKGRTSVVFEAQDVVCHETCAVKTLLPAFVLEAVDHEDFRSLFPKFNIADIQYYTAELLKALQFCHAKGVIHRDIRPHNLVINYRAKQQPGASHTVRISLFKAPELLLGYDRYDYSLDMWGVGAILASLVFRREPFFHGIDTVSMLRCIAKTLGTDELCQFVCDYDIELDQGTVEELGNYVKRPWQIFLTDVNENENEKAARDRAMDLIDQLLRYNPSQRLSAEQALQHNFITQEINLALQ
ncbi:hypothetical protein NQ176_g5249 [Zarea fungicola]|uniref:Uncharacterized protein n=1 Tax=Zarea fungicola TaxID=93591 RepID=A0ACC1NBA6_9HYPO|nr:hypothetical protein NQ176_g5249 [Lecanicillium fungicola]